MIGEEPATTLADVDRSLQAVARHRDHPNCRECYLTSGIEAFRDSIVLRYLTVGKETAHVHNGAKHRPEEPKQSYPACPTATLDKLSSATESSSKYVE